MVTKNPTQVLNKEDDLAGFQDIPSMQDMTLALFGATGDLAKRKLYPALYNLFLDEKLPEKISIIGLGRTELTDEIFQSKVAESLNDYSRRTVQTSHLQEFLAKFRYSVFDATADDSYQYLLETIEQREEELEIPQNRMFYLSVAPGLVDLITSNLKSSGICQNDGWKRLIIEKPFGSNLETARQLNKNLSKTFSEDEIYRIDHYLGKPMVQNLQTLILANPVLESLLDHKQISNVQITASETVGVQGRADYYDKSGAIRDMVQNHLLQVLMMTAVYLPEKTNGSSARTKKTEILDSLRPIGKENAHEDIVRGQYAAGEIGGEPVISYKDEPGISEDSNNDTYFAARMYIDHPSWDGIPFYIRTGKRMNEKSTQIIIEFKNKIDGSELLEGTSPNLLVLEISPNENISLRMNMKDPSSNQFKPAWINFSTNAQNHPEAYELLLYDAMLGNSTFFAHWKEVELSWKWIEPLLEAFEEDLLPLHSYQSGSTGPEASDALLRTDNNKWW